MIEFLQANYSYIVALVGVFFVGGAAGGVAAWLVVIAPLRARQDALEVRIDELDPETRTTVRP